MKKIKLALVAVAAIAFAAFTQNASASADDTPGYAPQTCGVFTNAGSAATNIGYVMTVGKQRTVSVSITTSNSGAGDAVNANIIYYQRSVDGSKYNSALLPIGWTSSGVTEQTIVTNIDCGGAGYVKLLYSTNASAAGTNTGVTIVKYGATILRP